MKTITLKRNALIASLALGFALIFGLGTTNAAASDHGHRGFGGGGVFIRGGGYGIGIGYGGGYHSHVWVDGYYDSVLQPVLVSPEHYEHRFVEPLYQSNTGPDGVLTTVCIREGHYEDVLVPACYENRYVQVWHEGCYRDY